MNYSLGNMLSRGGALNPDGLALDLQFAADKTLTARKGPTPTFTRASTATFVGSDGLIQSAAINTPRFDHDPVTLACKGLLIEESRINLLPDSNSFNNWAQNSCDIITSTIVTPEGSSNAWKIREDLLFAVHYVTKGFTPVSGTTYTASVWLKSGENGFVFFGLTGGFPTTFVSVNLSTGAVSAAIGTPIQAISASYLNGWWRVSFSLVATASTNSNFDIRTSRDGVWANRTYLGNGVNGVYCYGAQVEAGSFPTSYIPTTTASVVRSADVCSITGSNFSGFYNQPEGTFFGDATPQTVNQTIVIVGANTSASTASHFIYKSNNLINAAGKRWTAQTVSTGAQTSIVTGADVAISASKLSYAYKLNDFAFVYAGSIVGTDSSGTIPTPTAMRIGCRDDGLQINGHIAAIRYYKKRLSNAKLQSLTT
jgi:hypothetical protein